MSNKIYLTQKQKEDLEQRVHDLEHIYIPQNAKDLKAAKEQGDLSENAEYDEAKEENARLHHELTIANYKLDNAEIIQADSNKDEVSVGHTVSITYNDKKMSLTILGEWDQSEETTSIEAPLGEALLGKKPGDTFYVEAPQGDKKCTLHKIL